MFGVVPKTLWAEHGTYDEYNRVKLDTNCLIVRNRNQIGVIDTGYGSKASFKEQERDGIERFKMAAGHALIDNLARVGIEPSQVNWVVLPHLLFDHVGGCPIHKSCELKAVFSRAWHFIQRPEWEDATGDLPELVDSYFHDDCANLESPELVELIDGDAELFPEISVGLVEGHKRGHQIVLILSDSQTFAYLSDLSPFTAHLKKLWSMSYDQFPLTLRRTKPVIQEEAVTDR